MTINDSMDLLKRAIDPLPDGLQKASIQSMLEKVQENIDALMERDSDNIEALTKNWSAKAACLSAASALSDLPADTQFIAVWIKEDQQTISWRKNDLTPVGAGALAAFVACFAEGLNRQYINKSIGAA